MAKKTIARAPKDADNPYRMINRHAMEDDRLSFEARGLLAYILVKPDYWRVRITDLRRSGNIGRDKAYRILNELIAFGYVIREMERNEDGTISEMVYKVDEKPTNSRWPSPEKPEMVEPLPEKPDTAEPDTAEPDTEKPDTTNKEVFNNKELISNNEDDTDDDDDDGFSFFVKANGRARADREAIRKAPADPELIGLRVAANEMVAATLGGSWDGWNQYRDGLSTEQLRLLCYWCQKVNLAYLTMAGDDEDDPISNPVGLVRHGVGHNIPPGIPPGDEKTIDDFIQFQIQQVLEERIV